MRFPIALAALVVGSAALADAAPSNPVVGMWRMSAPGGTNITIRLNADGSEDQTIDAPGRFTRMRATYTAENGVFTEHFLTGTENGKPVSGSMRPQSFRYSVTATTLTLGQGRYSDIFRRYSP